LEGLAMQHGGKPEEMVTPAEERTTQAPAWVAAQQQSPATPTPAEPTPPAAAAQPSAAPEMNSDDALRWLEGLAMQHGGKPEEMVTPAEERTTQAPAWVAAQQATAVQSAPESKTSIESPPASRPQPVEPEATQA